MAAAAAAYGAAMAADQAAFNTSQAAATTADNAAVGTDLSTYNVATAAAQTAYNNASAPAQTAYNNALVNPSITPDAFDTMAAAYLTSLGGAEATLLTADASAGANQANADAPPRKPTAIPRPRTP